MSECWPIRYEVYRMRNEPPTVLRDYKGIVLGNLSLEGKASLGRNLCEMVLRWQQEEKEKERAQGVRRCTEVQERRTEKSSLMSPARCRHGDGGRVVNVIQIIEISSERLFCEFAEPHKRAPRCLFRSLSNRSTAAPSRHRRVYQIRYVFVCFLLTQDTCRPCL